MSPSKSGTSERNDMRVTMCKALTKGYAILAPAFRHRYLGMLWSILWKGGVCKPYAFYPCGNHTNEKWYGECPSSYWPTPKCRTVCKYGYRKPYEQDKYYAKSAYTLPKDEAAIRKEIMENGPVQATFTVYQDFYLYRKGIYKHMGGWKTGAHAVKILGWGTEKITNSTHTIDVPYWLIANSWNVDWGEQGYFRMIRGEDNCGIESSVTVGIMVA
ncbi:papain family cysteine protease [Ancylostoma duodenale]|uniref:Papain family cysteine protease n=1 Tax=Ancylostoma duodenale TaxID=51022 RepID=A0A0C2HEZ8_9BILA|nr:papain family cysteine protease [Ancylostoma duodenale]